MKSARACACVRACIPRPEAGAGSGVSKREAFYRLQMQPQATRSDQTLINYCRIQALCHCCCCGGGSPITTGARMTTRS